MPGLERILSRRTWFVPDFAVWGQPSLGEHEYLALEQVGATWSVYYGTAAIGESDQEVLFSQLTDHRGNALPGSIKSPRVLVRAKGSESAFVVGQETSDQFKIARDMSAPGPVVIDLYIVELGD
ncbi:MAG: hypothetical protein AB1772_05470 [Candidatus Zixiibacteriota bacterium]